MAAHSPVNRHPGYPVTASAPAFGDAFRFTLITSDPALAARADHACVDRVGIDLERLGKASRQAGVDARLSEHRIEDLAAVAQRLARAEAFVRMNPLNPASETEIGAVLRAGAKVLMLPYFHTAAEVETFIRLVAGRARVVILLETAAAVIRVREILAVPGIDEVMIGLNDLRLGFGVQNHFEVLASPMLDWLAQEVRRANLAFSVGGVARPENMSLPVPPDLVLAQYPRLGATGAWISRSFFRDTPKDWDFASALSTVRRRLDQWASASPAALEDAREKLAASARAVALRNSPI